jgi:Fic family protein
VARPYAPPFSLSAAALASFAEIMRRLGQHDGLSRPRPQPQLRKQNRIRTVRSSVAIEGNSLTEDQVTAILDERRVVGSKREILEVQNAIAVYEGAAKLDPTREAHLLGAHARLMRDLIADAGRYRTRGVGVFHGSRVAHVAPPAKQVHRLVDQLLGFLATDATPAIVKSALVHYELEFIHPFSDGNGRIGRLWQHVVLLRVHPIFEFVPFESAIKKRQAAYYRVLGECDRAGDASRFVAFSLDTIVESLSELTDALRPEPLSVADRLRAARETFGSKNFTRKDYLRLHKTLSTATASRDLRAGVAGGQLARSGEKALTRYRFVNRTRSRSERTPAQVRHVRGAELLGSGCAA